MKTYDLYLESGPKRKKTMVHVFELLGCIANGATSDDAVAAAPEAIRTYLRFLKRHGERVDPEAPFDVRVAEHIAETAIFIGQGSPYIIFGPDLEPVTPKESETYVARFHAMRETLAEWAESKTDWQLAAEPKGGGRPARSVLLHVLNGTGYLSPVLGTIPGMSSLYNAAEKGQVPLGEAFRRVDEAVGERLREATVEQRRAVIQRPKEVRTLRKGIRRLLEHDWEHLAELSRRPGGPEL
jgi:predicted RNase H-like HicB family nuclease